MMRSIRPDAFCAGVDAPAGSRVAGMWGPSCKCGSRARLRTRAAALGDYALRRPRCRPARCRGPAGTMRRPASPTATGHGIARAMRVFGFAGWSGSGKTTLIEQIIPRLVERGLVVSLVKHAHHTRRNRPAGQGLVPAPPRGLQRGPGVVGHALGADARAARRARAHAAQRRSRGFRPATSRSLKATRRTRSRSSKSGEMTSASRCCTRRIRTFSASRPTARTRCRRNRRRGCRCSRFPTLMRSQHSSPQSATAGPLGD